MLFFFVSPLLKFKFDVRSMPFTNRLRQPSACATTTNEHAANPRRRPKLSLPTKREVRFLTDCGCFRSPGRPQGSSRQSAFSVHVWSLQTGGCTADKRAEIEEWAYITRLRANRSILGKRAVVRNKAKRRIRAAANAIMPLHAARCKEYVFTIFPEALTIGFGDLKNEMCNALVEINCWRETLADSALRRPVY